MISFQVRPTAKMVQHVARIERLAGRWDRIGQSEVFSSELRRKASLEEAAQIALLLDSTTLAHIPNPLDPLQAKITISKVASEGAETLPHSEFLTANALAAYQTPLALNQYGITSLYRAMLPSENEQTPSPLRTSQTTFIASEKIAPSEGTVFPAVSPFLVEQRINELLAWIGDELRLQTFHPFLLIGAFHLLFLQISPFPRANHRFSLLLAHRLLIENGYHFSAYANFSKRFLQQPKQYYSALRQAEKTASTNWSTLNVWLEFFLEALYSFRSRADSRERKTLGAKAAHHRAATNTWSHKNSRAEHPRCSRQKHRLQPQHRQIQPQRSH